MKPETARAMFKGVFLTMARRVGAAVLAGLLLARVVAADKDAGVARPALPGVQPIELPGIHNAFQIGPRYFSGSAPEDDAAFAALARLGVRTIITVDGSQPDVESARRHGIRYIHLPHGYDGVSTNAEIQIQKAVATIPGPIYFHCHHGKHRGPAAAAIACIATEGWSPEMADHWLHLAGTDTNYAGLYRTVKTFRPLTADALKAIPADLPEHARVSRLIDTMVEIDGRWDALQTFHQAGDVAPRNHPDLDPANEATILMEHFREARRLDDAKRRGDAFLKGLADAERLSGEWAALLREWNPAAPSDGSGHLAGTRDRLGQACTACHRDFRNGTDRAPVAAGPKRVAPRAPNR